MFIDEATITVKAGDGGHGIIVLKTSPVKGMEDPMVVTEEREAMSTSGRTGV